MKENDKDYPKARYDFDTNPQVYGFKIGKTYQFRDFGRGIEVFYGDGCSLAMGYNMFNECFTVMKANEAPEKIYINPNLENRTWLIGKGDTSFIEYTHTGAFIEKVYEWLKNYAFTDDENKVHLPTLLHDFLKDIRNL